MLAVAALVGAASVPTLAQPTARTAIVVAPIGASDMAAVYYAVQQRLFERARLDVTISAVPSGGASLVAVVGGAAQIGFANTLALVTARTKGIPVVLLTPGAQYDPARPNTVLIVAADSALKAPKDLEDRVVAVTGLHDFLTVAVSLWLTKNAADPARVKFVEMPPGTMLPALAAKRIDAAVSYEPFLSSALGTGAKVFGKPFDAVGTGFISGAWFALGPWANAHRDAVIRFARILDQASQYADAHYDDLIPLIATFSKLPPETLHQMVPDHVPPTLTATAVQPVIDAAARAHEIAAPFPAAEMIFPGVP